MKEMNQINNPYFKIYVYILTYDTGFAPCYANNEYTLANCKPTIRRNIFNNWDRENEKNNNIWVAGIKGINKKDGPPNLVYLANIQKVILLEEYYKDNGDYVNRCDCIYRNAVSLNKGKALTYDEVISNNKLEHIPKYTGKHFFNFRNKNTNSDDKKDQLRRDIAGNCVLYSTKFVHFGENEKDPEDELIKKIITDKKPSWNYWAFEGVEFEDFFIQYIDNKSSFFRRKQKDIKPRNWDSEKKYTGLLSDYQIIGEGCNK